MTFFVNQALFRNRDSRHYAITSAFLATFNLGEYIENQVKWNHFFPAKTGL